MASHGYRWVVQGSDEPPEAFMPLEIAATDDEGMDEQLALICGKAEYAQPIADFLAHARADIPTLLDECERLRAENAHLRKMCEAIVGAPVQSPEV